jgi:hypothetical protein
LTVASAHGLRAPQENRAVVAEPPLAETGRLLDANRARFASSSLDILGRPLSKLRAEARPAAVAAAREYLSQGGEPIPAFGSDSLLLAGHQPELFHPGVWVKNFALHHLAHLHGATPLNLVVDNDTVKGLALRVPRRESVESAWPQAALVSFDRWTSAVPYEEYRVQDEALFASLPERVMPLLREWPYVPLLPDFWAEVALQTERTPLLGERFATARRTVERGWGCHNLEVPVSALCRTEPFAWFAGHLVAQIPTFHATYNACVHDYRRRYGIRSRNHPFPDLLAEGDWLELPFWGWRTGQTQRGRLMARWTPDEISLRSGKETWPSLPRGDLVAAWLDLERRGYKVRSRALTNTLFCRLFLADLFVHGIGGGKYDELTDELLRRFYGIEPPAYLILSGTLRLPLPRYPASTEDCRRLARAIRDLHYNPQRHLPDGLLSDAVVRDLAERKRQWIDQTPADRHGRRERFHVLRTLTEQMRGYLDGAETKLAQELTLRQREVQSNAVLGRRDYAFVLYPEAELRAFRLV